MKRWKRQSFSDTADSTKTTTKWVAIWDQLLIQQEQQRVAVDQETRISFLFARCRPTQSRCGAEHVRSVVWPAAAAAAAVAADTALGILLSNN